MSFPTDLPPSASLLQKVFYPFLRAFFFFFFTYLPYAPIRRWNRPKLSPPYIWASSHNNFLCDVVIPSWEGTRPTKFLAKSTLFQFPIKAFIEFCGAIPLARMEDFRGRSKETVDMNRASFRSAIEAMEQGWPVTIFPEGASRMSPGLVLPLKPGVVKLALAALEYGDALQELQIIPVGLEYGERAQPGSGLQIRYGNPISVKDYFPQYMANKGDGLRKLLNDLTAEILKVFPHFENQESLLLAEKLIALGLAETRLPLAELFRKIEKNESHRAKIMTLFSELEVFLLELGLTHHQLGGFVRWSKIRGSDRGKTLFFLFLSSPFAFVALLNGFFSELLISFLVRRFSADDTEVMTVRFFVAPLVLLPLVYAQMKACFFVFGNLGEGVGGVGFYFCYLFASVALWYLWVHWKRKAAIPLAAFQFWKIYGKEKERSQAVLEKHKNLGQDLGQLQNHSR